MALTEKQSAFVEGVTALGLSAAESARRAGYADGEEAYRVQRVPAVQAAIHAARAALIAGDGARLAWRTMSRLMEDNGTPPAVQFQAARWVLEASGQGLAARIAERGVEPEKALAEMSLGELEGFIARGRAALGALKSAAAPVVSVEAVPVESYPVGSAPGAPSALRSGALRSGAVCGAGGLQTADTAD